MSLIDSIAAYKERSAVVIELGSAYSKAGFASETCPRCIIRSEVRREKTGKIVEIKNVEDCDELYHIFKEFLHIIYFRHLLANPKDRRVVIVESLLCSTVHRDTLAKVLFEHYEVPSVLFAPSHLMATFTLGVDSAMVLDAGYEESVALPVIENVPILSAWQALPLGAKVVHKNIEEMLLKCNVKNTEMEEEPLTNAYGTLPECILEDIKVRCCFVTRFDRTQVSAEDSEKKSVLPPQDMLYPLQNGYLLNLPGSIRETACEVLFELDNEEKSLATLILDAILQCPIDSRKVMAQNIILTGGTCMLKGFRHRLLSEIHHLVKTNNKYNSVFSTQIFKIHQTPCLENCTAWLGGSIFGGLEILASRSIPNAVYAFKKTIPDWASLKKSDEVTEKLLKSVIRKF